MAEKITLSEEDTKPGKMPEGWVASFCPRWFPGKKLKMHAARSQGDEETVVLDEIEQWLNDPSRKGRYGTAWSYATDPKTFEMYLDNIRFYFDHPETAIEFRLRWC